MLTQFAQTHTKKVHHDLWRFGRKIRQMQAAYAIQDCLRISLVFFLILILDEQLKMVHNKKIINKTECD